MNKQIKKIISIFLIELIILLPIAIAQSINPQSSLYVEAAIPSYHTSQKINIQGKSTASARINMYVNNNVPRTLNADSNGNFIFKDVALNEGSNTIRFTAEYQGQTIEKAYSITVDTIDPAVTIDEIPNIIGSERITIKGSVSEQATISFYITTGEEDIIPPPKVTGLKSTKIQANLVELSWDHITADDFQQYIVYRNDKPLGIGSDSSYNDYSDVLANSAQTYTYKVAAMDKNGNIGETSDPITVTTLPGGRTDLPEEEVDIYENINKPKKTITADKTFEEEIEIGKEDGFYNIKIEASDKAQNKWLYEKDILIDTKDPEIEIISPKSNADIFENYADMVTIRGKTEPGARAYLYVLRTPFGVLDDAWDVYGAADEIQKIPESDLRADCRLKIQGKEQCKTHSDYETVADAQGYFEFEDVDLTSMWAGSFRITEYPTGEPYYEFIQQRELKDFIESELLFIAVDPAGRKGAEQINYEIVTCWTKDLAWSITPLVEYQSPTFLNVERLKEGTESIYLYLNFTYHGRGKDTKNTRITNINIKDACGYGYLENQKRYNYSCDILRSCTEKLSPKGKTAYIACPLGRLEGIEKWMDSDWESFIDAVKDEMTFPFRLTITYDEEFENKSIEQGKTYYVCTEVGYLVDAAYVNPKEILPDWLLYDFVDSLNKTIDRMNDWIQQIRKILEWAALGCMASFFVKFVTQIYRRMTCYYDRFFKKLERIGTKIDQENECRQCINDYDPKLLKKFDENKDVQDLISDKCLEVCYPTCSAAWKSEESLYQTYRWACDRVFGHSTPSRWTESSSDTELFQKLSEGKGCSNDDSVRGRPLRAVSCKEVEEKYRIKGTFDMDDKCLEITSHTGNKRTETLYHIDGPYSQGKDVYKISKMDTSAPSLTYDLVIKQNEDNYLAPMEQSCEQICKGQSTGERVQVGLQTARGKIKLENKGEVKSKTLEENEEGKYYITYGCITANQCVSYRSGETKQLPIEGKNEYVDVKTAVPMGYTSDCFAPEYVSGDPDKRIECCCINSQAGAIPEYFQPGDIENKDGEFGDDGYENMKWSYRYYKMEKDGGYKDKKYNPDRYIEGRDQMACFGQDHWLYDGFSKGNLLIINPMTDHTSIAAFQCVAISQILNRLYLLKNIMVALENCLLSIRTTGEADTGVCKEIFTQYICAFIWKIITFIRDGCLPFGIGVDFSASENKVLEAVSVGMKEVWDSVADSQQELASEYGNAELNNLIGMGEQDVFRKVCLGAFGYDWEIDAESLLDVAYHTPYATLVQPVLQSREYLTFDPLTYKSKYEYRASWLINPGCDLDNYEVYLACVTRNDMYNNDDIDCSKQKDPYGINCDCLDLPPDKAPPELFYYQSRGKIKQNQMQNVDSTQIYDRIKTADYRYDHLMFKLNIDRNYIKNQGDVSMCFPPGHADGVFYFPITDFTAREVAGCSIDTTTGQFSCRQGASFFYEQGNAWFTEIKVGDSTTSNILKPEKATYNAGDNPTLTANVRYEKDEKKQCLVARLLDKDGHTVIRAPKALELRQGETSGEEPTRAIYQIGDKDITGSGYGFTIGYTEEGRTLPAVAKLTYTPLKKADKEGEGGPLIFIDADDSGKIEISVNSNDKYEYGSIKNIKDCDRGGWCEIDLENIGAKIRVDRVYPTSPGEYKFFVQYISRPEQRATLEPRFYLHLDLRYPKTPDGNCDDVRGVEFDESQIIVSNGISQSVNIPIHVLPGTSSANKCKTEYERKQQLTGKDNQCVCGDGKTENCPQENTPTEDEDDYRHCYGTCREYPKCVFNEQQNNPCVCNPGISASKFDCGGSSEYPDADFEGVSRVGWYCYEQNGKPACTQKTPPSAPAPTGPQDIQPLKVTLENPTTGLERKKGDKINIKATIEDDIASGQEQYEIIVDSIPVWAGENKEKEKKWVVEYELTVKEDPPKVLNIFVRGIDQSMTSGTKTSDSKTARVNIVAEYSS